MCLTLFHDGRELLSHRREENRCLRQYHRWILDLRRCHLSPDQKTEDDAKQLEHLRRLSDGQEKESMESCVVGCSLPIKVELPEQVPIDAAPLAYSCSHQVSQLQCFGSESGFRGSSGSGFRIRIQGLKKRSKMSNNQTIILLVLDFYTTLSFN